jgi:hypothetical protein
VRPAACSARTAWISSASTSRQSPDDRHVGDPVLRDLRRVDVGVHDLGVGREARQLAGDPVVEAGAERDQQVGLLQRGDRGHRAVHAGHPQVLRWLSGNAPRAIRVVTTGAPVSSARASSSSVACALSTPPPT